MAVRKNFLLLNILRMQFHNRLINHLLVINYNNDFNEIIYLFFLKWNIFNETIQGQNNICFHALEKTRKI